MRAAARRARRELGRGGVVALANVRDPLVEPAQHEIGLFERREFGPQLLELCRQRGRLDAMLARKVFERGDAALDRVLPRRVRIEPVEIDRQLRAGLAQRDQRFLDERERRLDARIERRLHCASMPVARAASACASLPSPS